MSIGILLGIAAAFFWSLTNLVDKYLVETYAQEKGVAGILVLSCLFPIVILIITPFFATDIFLLPIKGILFLVLSGILSVVWIYFYLQALRSDDASIVMTLLVLAPLFSLLLGYLVLDEVLTTITIAGGALVISGSILVSFMTGTMSINKSLVFYAVCASITMGCMHVLFKYVALNESFWQSLFWKAAGMLGTGIFLLVAFPQIRRDFKQFIQAHFIKAISLNSTNEILTIIGDSIFAFALLFAPVAIVQTTEGFQPIFIIITILTLTKLGFTRLTTGTGEVVDLSSVRIVGIAIVLLGSIILSIST